MWLGWWLIALLLHYKARSKIQRLGGLSVILMDLECYKSENSSKWKRQDCEVELWIVFCEASKNLLPKFLTVNERSCPSWRAQSSASNYIAKSFEAENRRMRTYATFSPSPHLSGCWKVFGQLICEGKLVRYLPLFSKATYPFQETFPSARNRTPHAALVLWFQTMAE